MSEICKCEICQKDIDKSACGQNYTVITIHKDKNEKHTKETIYLCELHTLKLEYGFLNDSLII